MLVDGASFALDTGAVAVAAVVALPGAWLLLLLLPWRTVAMEFSKFDKASSRCDIVASDDFKQASLLLLLMLAVIAFSPFFSGFLCCFIAKCGSPPMTDVAVDEIAKAEEEHEVEDDVVVPTDDVLILDAGRFWF